MPMDPKEVANLRSVFEKAKSKPVNFAICLGKTPANLVFVTSISKEPSSLALQAKRDGETMKVGFGTISVEGSKLKLLCTEDVPKGIAKQTKKFLSLNKLKLKVVALDASGQEVEGGDEEGEGEGEEGGTTEAVVVETSAGGASETVEAEAEAPAEDPRAKEWAKLAAVVDPRVTAYVAAGGEKAPAVSKIWDLAQATAAKGDYPQARAAVEKILPLLPQAGAKAETSAPEQPASPAPQPEKAPEKANGKAATVDLDTYRKAARLWQDALGAMQTEIGKLESAIVAHCNGDPRFAEVIAAAGDLPDRLDAFGDGLGEALQSLADEADPEKSPALRQKAQAAIKGANDALSDPFFRDVDDNNGFAKVAVAAIARRTLGALERAVG